MRVGSAPVATRCATGHDSVLVFPEPAPAMTSSGSGPVLNGRALLRIQIRKRLSPHRIDSRHARKLTCFAFVRNAGSVNVRNRIRS